MNYLDTKNDEEGSKTTVAGVTVSEVKTAKLDKIWFDSAFFEKSQNAQQEIHDLTKKDIKGRIRGRFWVSFALIVLLFFQNLAVFYLAYLSLVSGALENLQNIFVAFIGGTLAETYYVIRIIVHWLFQDINYDSMHKHAHEVDSAKK